ncbi:MAG TPA: M23 family metallopeptidase [Thermoanaerobaculia bacterium]|nr:M23 family metallopeptidase [Thermoanaerobaculia bacterium]
MRPRASRPKTLGTAAGPPAGPWFVEVQIHPADGRRKVRYLFLGRLALTVACSLILGYLFLVSLGLALAKDVLSAALGGAEIKTLATERAHQGDRLQGLVAELSALDEQTKGLRLQHAKLRLAYGLPPRHLGAAEPVTHDEDESIYGGAIAEGEHIRSVVERNLSALDKGLAEVRRYEAAHPAEVAEIPSRCPLAGDDLVLVTPFGNHRNPFTKELESNPGIDLAATAGAPVVAVAAGVVAFAGQASIGSSPAWFRLGQIVVVRHGDRFATAYGHLDRIDVRAGAPVVRGAQLGTVGKSGWALAPQLHFEVRRRDPRGALAPVDPRIYMLDRHWHDEERLIVRAAANPWAAPGTWEPMPGVR